MPDFRERWSVTLKRELRSGQLQKSGGTVVWQWVHTFKKPVPPPHPLAAHVTPTAYVTPT